MPNDLMNTLSLLNLEVRDTVSAVALDAWPPWLSKMKMSPLAEIRMPFGCVSAFGG